jgi:hypothetical protein
MKRVLLLDFSRDIPRNWAIPLRSMLRNKHIQKVRNSSVHRSLPLFEFLRSFQKMIIRKFLGSISALNCDPHSKAWSSFIISISFLWIRIPGAGDFRSCFNIPPVPPCNHSIESVETFTSGTLAFRGHFSARRWFRRSDRRLCRSPTVMLCSVTGNLWRIGKGWKTRGEAGIALRHRTKVLMPAFRMLKNVTDRYPVTDCRQDRWFCSAGLGVESIPGKQFRPFRYGPYPCEFPLHGLDTRRLVPGHLARR